MPIRHQGKSSITPGALAKAGPAGVLLGIEGTMGKVVLIGAAVLVVLVIVAAGVLMFWDVPAPSARVEHVIPDAKLPH